MSRLYSVVKDIVWMFQNLITWATSSLYRYWNYPHFRLRELFVSIVINICVVGDSTIKHLQEVCSVLCSLISWKGVRTRLLRVNRTWQWESRKMTSVLAGSWVRKWKHWQLLTVMCSYRACLSYSTFIHLAEWLQLFHHWKLCTYSLYVSLYKWVLYIRHCKAVIGEALFS